VTKSELGKVIAFYSYKGGTGRTMALANVGCALARDAKLLRPVLLVDWDLEAPGLHRYLRKQVTSAFRGDEGLFDNAPGLIDLFIELRNHIATQSDPSKPEQDFDAVSSLVDRFPLESYIIKTDIPRLHLLKAGRFDNDYAANIASFHWLELYHRSPYLLRAFADRLANDYSSVVIDSRTGLTDTSGICAMLMPEVLVTVFTPNRQSLFGVIDLIHEAARYRAKSDDLRPLMIYPLPSRIEASEPALRQSWRFGDSSAGVPGFQGMFERAFKEIYELPACDLGPYFDDVQVQHLPSYAYGEEIALLVEESRDRFSLTQSYLRFTARLTKGDPPWVSSTSGEETVEDQILLERRLPIESGWRWFLSYHSPDQALAERLKAAIERKHSGSRVFLARTHLRAGGPWGAQLAEQIAEANAFVLLVGERGIGDWQVCEYDEALDERAKYPDFPIILVLLEGETAPGLPFLRQVPWIVTSDPASEKAVAQLIDAAAGGGARPRDLWRYTAPYRGLAAMTEIDSDFFFGRERETAEVIKGLAAAPEKLPVLLGNSGVGKSSVAQAGVLAALMRQGWPETSAAASPWPQVFNDSRRWCFIKLKPGTEPVRALVEPFLRIWQFDAVDPGRLRRFAEWTDGLTQGRATLRDLIDATERRLEERSQTAPPAFLIYVDQGEELYVRAEERQRRRLSEILADGLGDPRLRALMSMRADFLGELQKDEPLYSVHRVINIPPMREGQLRDVVSRPAELLSARFETAELADIITRRTAEDSVKDAGALPLLSYALDDMWTQMVQRGDGVLRLAAQSFELGTVLVQRADSFLARNPRSEQALRHIFTLKLATVREDGEPTRRRAVRSEFSEEEWWLVAVLADYPNRLLVTATSDAGETYAEVASEAIFRRWDKLREWIVAEREFLAWRSELEAARRAWQAAPEFLKYDALLMGAALARAQRWYGARYEDLSHLDREFVALSNEREKKVQARARRGRTLVYVLLVWTIVGLVGWINQSYIEEQWRWYTLMRPYLVSQVRPYVLTVAQEQALKPGSSFRECATNCPEMIVVPAGSFLMGSPLTEQERNDDEGPQHQVTISQPFAVSKFELTFDQWDTCVAKGDCEANIGDAGWGRDKRPVIFVTWDHAQRYVAWFSKMTGKPYRLLTEAEYEYATRAGTRTAFPWGEEIANGMANCNGCGSQWDNKKTAPVGSFAANGFGLFDMVGNVFEWTADCYHDNYDGAPMDGSAWTADHCGARVVRAGSWSSNPGVLRSAARERASTANRNSNLGFRIGRTLAR
jgi:formylglycine-generating enzyme required for sulfatase activity/cellulose biosynthesis protein BcsQ